MGEYPRLKQECGIIDDSLATFAWKRPVQIIMRRRSRLIISFCAVLILVALVIVEGASVPEILVPPRSNTIISGVTVINPGVGRFVDYSIVIREGVIREVWARAPWDPDPICTDCFAVPGLIDAHVHTPPRIVIGNQPLFALLYLAHGVTTVRDVGASDGSIADLAARLNNGDLVGPQMLRCGPVLEGDPPGWPMARVIEDAQAGTEIVTELAKDGVDCIKVYNELSVEAYDAISTAARQFDIPVIGHVPHNVGLENILDFEAQHMTGVPYLSRPRPPTGWDIRNEDVLLLSDIDIDHAFDIALRQRVSFTPTLANFRLRLIASDPERFPPTPASDHLPEYWAAQWDLIAGHPSTEEEISLQVEAMPKMRLLVRRAHERGIDVLAGTDTLIPWVVPGESLHLELAELADELGDVESALAAATTVNGRHLGNGELGMIAPGARADILLTRTDPTIELAALREWQVLFTDGRRYDRATVDGWLIEYRQYFHGWFQQKFMAPVVAAAATFFVHE